MLDVEIYRLYNGLRARDLMPCLCHDFAVIFAIFTKVCHVFTYFTILPWFSTVPINDIWWSVLQCFVMNCYAIKHWQALLSLTISLTPNWPQNLLKNRIVVEDACCCLLSVIFITTIDAFTVYTSYCSYISISGNITFVVLVD